MEAIPSFQSTTTLPEHCLERRFICFTNGKTPINIVHLAEKGQHSDNASMTLDKSWALAVIFNFYIMKNANFCISYQVNDLWKAMAIGLVQSWVSFITRMVWKKTF